MTNATRAPFNPVYHELLLMQGYTWIPHECSFEDIGDGESGPMLSGGPAYDLYQNEKWEIIVEADGTIPAEGVQMRDLELEAYFESMIDAREDVCAA